MNGDKWTYHFEWIYSKSSGERNIRYYLEIYDKTELECKSMFTNDVNEYIEVMLLKAKQMDSVWSVGSIEVTDARQFWNDNLLHLDGLVERIRCLKPKNAVRRKQHKFYENNSVHLHQFIFFSRLNQYIIYKTDKSDLKTGSFCFCWFLLVFVTSIWCLYITKTPYKHVSKQTKSNSSLS